MTEFPLQEAEIRRIAALYQLEILDTEPEEDYDNIAFLAAQVCNMPVSMIGFIDHSRTWYKSCMGFDLKETLKHDSFWPDKLGQSEPIVIQDTLLDEHAADHDLVTKSPFLRSTAIVPLLTEDGYTVGHLSVADIVPRVLTRDQLMALKMLAKQISSLLKLRLQIIRLHKIDQQSKDNLDQISTIFRSAVDAVIITREDGLISQWNPKAELMFGWKVNEVIGKYFQELIIPERFIEAFWTKKREFKGFNIDPEENIKYEFVAKRKDGSEFDAAMGISPAQINGQTVFVGFVSDITHQKRITLELDKQKEFYENILNKIPTDIAVFGPDHKYLFVNPGAIKDPELRKYIVGKDDFEYAQYRNRPREIAIKRRERFLEAIAKGEEIRWEDSMANPEGKVITHLRRLFPVYDEHHELSFVIGFGLDITDRKVLEEKQDLLVKQLSAQNVQLLDFCNIVSHNLRGPLINMTMLVDFIKETSDQEEQKLLVSKLNPVLDSLNSTFNDLVESIQIRQDLEIKSERIDLYECLHKVLDSLEMEISKTSAVFRIDFSDAPIVSFPTKYLLSIFHNLITNSLKYYEPDRPLLIEIETKREGTSIILSVKDNGLGIDLQKHQDHVFKIGKVFHRHPNAKGLGLYMTKVQVEAMGGSIGVTSIPGEGSTFKVEFKNQYSL